MHDSKKHAMEPWDLVHSDLKEFPTLSYHKFKYIINFLDDPTGLAMLANLCQKSKALKAYRDFTAAVNTQ